MPVRPAATIALLATIAIAGCASQTPTPTGPNATGGPTPASLAPTAETSSPAPSADAWLVATIQQPAPVVEGPSLPPNFECHPCHYLAENDLLGVGTTPQGLIAVGIQSPPAAATAFRSADGTSWTPLPGFSGVDGSAAVAVASNGGRTVIVGHDHDGATSWASDGGTWATAPRQDSLLVPDAAGGMTSVTAFGSGFVAGGYRDDPLQVRSAAGVWRSDDGLTWTLDDGSAFAGGRILGMAASGSMLVAVGTNGDPNYGPAAAWRWTAATGWQRARLEPDDGGAMRAVVATKDGFVAVGLAAGDHGAMSWTSSDGMTWTAAQDQPGFHNFDYPVRMQSVATTPGGFVAGGWRSDPGKGSAMTWTSTDGVHWPSTWETSFSGGEIDGMALVDGRVVAAGRTGYPDWNTATVWTRPVP